MHRSKSNEITDIFKMKNIKYTEVPKWGNYLRGQWEQSFASHMSRQEKMDIYLYDDDGACGYLWHLFSYGKRDCLKCEDADKAFDNMNKNECYIFLQHSDDVLIMENATELTSSDLCDSFDRTDVYVVNKGFNWTYVKTHEIGWCGPYFCRRD